MTRADVEVLADATAFGHRDAPFVLNVIGMWMDATETGAVPRAAMAVTTSCADSRQAGKAYENSGNWR
jgi:hypothetical protein